MYRSRKATAVFQHTNPLKEERFMKGWQVSKWSPLTKVYTQYNTWRMTSTPVLGLFIPPFTPKLIWGRRGQGPQQDSDAAAREQGTGAPQKAPYSLWGLLPTLPAPVPLGTAWNSVRQVLVVGAGAGAQRSSTGKHWYITSVRTSACTHQPD